MSRPNLHKMQTPSRPFTHQPPPNSLFPVRRRPCKTPPPQRPPKPTPAPPQRPLPSPLPPRRTHSRRGELSSSAPLSLTLSPEGERGDSLLADIDLNRVVPRGAIGIPSRSARILQRTPPLCGPHQHPLLP